MSATKTIKIHLLNGKTLLVGKTFIGSRLQKKLYPNLVKKGGEYEEELAGDNCS